MSVRAGVIAVQGDVSEHAATLERAVPEHDVKVLHVREPGIVPDCDWLAMPGGESTTISRLVHDTGLADEIRAHVEAGRPLLATCAGLIVASRDAADPRVETIDLLDVTVERNAFGRQRDSFEADIDVSGLDNPFHAVFIRAPAIADAGEATVLATWDGRPVAVRDGPVIGTAFHPELTDDPRIHRLAFADHLAAA
jgi:5'-phosphate synthase pdxT subunit